MFRSTTRWLNDEMSNDESYVIDDGFARWVAELRRVDDQPCRDVGAQRLREAGRARAASRPRGPDLPIVRDLRTDSGLCLRLYCPTREPRPATLYLHGGGFVMGDLDSHDSTCRRLAQIAEVTVLAVDYRLAPEYPGTAAVDDAVDAFGWACQHLSEIGGDPSAGLAVAGDSSGGALALLTAVRLHASGMTPSALFLAYPNADMTLSQPSVEQEGHGWGLDADDLRWFVEQWLPDHALSPNPQVSPLHADLAGLPPTILATAEHDPLRDEGILLAQQMGSVGVDVRHVSHPGLVHGFLGLGRVSTGADQADHEMFEQFGCIVHRRDATESSH